MRRGPGLDGRDIGEFWRVRRDLNESQGTKHSMATDAIRRGVSERHLQRFLGHASVESTRRWARLADNAMLEVLRPSEGDHRQGEGKGIGLATRHSGFLLLAAGSHGKPRDAKGPVEQPFLRKILYESSLRLTVLTPEYNCTPWIGYLNKSARILHHTAYGRRVLTPEDMERFRGLVNSSRDKRVYVSTRGRVRFFVHDQPG